LTCKIELIFFLERSNLKHLRKKNAFGCTKNKRQYT